MSNLTNYNASQNNSSGVTEKVRAVMVAILQQWPSAQIDTTDPANIWSNAINPLTTDQISYGIRKLATITNSYPINAAQFAAYARAMPVVEAPVKALPVGERDIAKRATNSAYANRVMQHLDLVVPLPEIKYEGDFDYRTVADCATLPPIGNHDHKPYWRQLGEIFNEEWVKYANG